MTRPHPDADLDQAAADVVRARRVLVTGLVGADAATAAAACDLAEGLGAAVDPGCPETSRVAGPLMARIGAVTAAPEELRDRADLVLLWFADPDLSDAGFIGRFVAPSVGGRDRRTIAVGPHAGPVNLAPHRHIACHDEDAVDLARLVEAAIRGVAVDAATADPRALEAARELAAAIAAADTVGLVSDWRRDRIGLFAWSTASLVRSIAHRKPAFEVPLGERDDAAVSVCTWRYGAAGAIERADPSGGRFLPAEADAVRLIEGRGIDCVVIVGEPPLDVSAAVVRAGRGLRVVRLAADWRRVRRLADLVAAMRGASA